MPPLGGHQSAQTTKMLFLGDSGAGKTGALASLARAGYNLRVIDLDNGLDVLANLLKDPSGPYGKEALSRVAYTTITDPMKNVNGKLIPSRASVWQRVATTLDTGKFMSTDGKTVEENFGPLTTWTDKDVLVIDSLTFLSTAALNFVMAMNARLGGQVQQGDWYSGQQLIESLLQMLYDDGIKCNVIIIAHVTYLGAENQPERGYPNTLGKALPPKVGRYFNSTLMAKTVGQGSSQKRTIHTTTNGMVELKNSAPLKVSTSYPLESGLADYFRDIRK